MMAVGQPTQPAPSVRRALTLVGLAYLLFTGGSVVLLLVVGGWAFLLLPGLAGLLYLALDLFRASVLIFTFLPPLSEFLPSGVAYTPWYAAFGTLVTSWLIALLRGRVHIPFHYLGFYAAFWGAVTLSIVFGVERGLHIPTGLQSSALQMLIEPLLASLISVLLIPAVTDRNKLRGLAWCIVLAGLGYTFPMFFIQLQEPGEPGYERSAGFFKGVHNAGVFEVFYLLVAAALLASEHSKTRRLFLAGSALLFLAGAYASKSRTAWVALAVLLLVVLWQDRSELRRRIRFGHWYLATVFLLLALPVVLVRVFMISPVALTSPGGFFGAPWQGRMILAVAGVDLFRQSPVTGIGFGMHTFLIPVQILPTGWSFPYIHNYYVILLAETGVVGLTAFMLIVGVTVFHFVRAIRGFRREGDAELYHLTRAFFFGFCTILGMFLTQGGGAGYRLFWAIVAMAFVARRLAPRTGGL